MKKKIEKQLGILNRHLITLATRQGWRSSKKDGKQDANQRGLVSVILILDKLNTIKKKRTVVFGREEK